MDNVNKGSKTGDLTNLSDDEFLHLLKEASTFNKPNKQESVLLTQLRKEVAEIESLENVNLVESSEQNRHSKILLYSEPNSSINASNSSQHRTLETKKKQARNREDACVKPTDYAQSQSLQDLLNSDFIKTKQKSHKTQRTVSLSEEAVEVVSDSVSKNSGKSELNKTYKYTLKPPDSMTIDQRNYVQSEIMPFPTIINPCDIPLPDEIPNPPLNPVEIEMEEIKNMKDKFSRYREIEKTAAHSNSKFYVEPTEVDATVTFPVKFVSSIEDQNSSVEAIQRQIPFPWSTRPLQVSSFFSSLPLEEGTFSAARNDKQLLNSDINGNPFSRSPRSASLASFVSTTLMDYNNSSLVSSESKNRKNKRLRNSINKGVLSENIAGHRGEEDIDTLLQYINSSDKKSKGNSVKGSSQILSNKTGHDMEKKKSFSKEIKNCHKSMMNAVKKKISNSLEDLISGTNMNDSVFSFDADATTRTSVDLLLKDVECLSSKNLDINSNVENQFTEGSGTDESSVQSPPLRQSSPEVSSFAADFYSTADVSSQTVEETGFLIVKKKQRKKHQSKRSDSYRWRTTQAQRKKGMMLPLAESKCGKQDSRRKSTSSVPHSEHSSADNSDLDSVHSLPVRGSVPHPTQPHPHTTPSSSSSTPQASYADIARMPISKLNSPAPYSTPKQTMESRADCLPKRRTGEVVRVSSHKDDDPVCSEMKVRSCSKSTREINTQTEPEPSETDDDASKNCKKADELSRNACVCSKKCSCGKSRPKGTMPAVIMDNMPSESNPCNVSFGFGIEEVLEMNPKSSAVHNEPTSAIRDLEPSSQCRTICYGTGRNLCYSETQVNIKKFNLSEIANFFGREFQCIEKEIGYRNTNGMSSRVMYYADSTEEA